MFCANLRRLILPCLLALLLAGPAHAQILFGSLIQSPDGPIGALFEVNNGVVSAIPTGLPNNQFPGLSPSGTRITISSPDPAQPMEASWDLFEFNRDTGQTRRLVNNVTQPLPDGGFIFSQPLFSQTSSDGQLIAWVNQVSSNNPQQQGGSHRLLNVIRASDGLPLSTAEIGQGNALDFYQSEFVGVSWWPGQHAFVTPAYVPGIPHSQAAGLVVFGHVGNGQFERVGQLTQPSVTQLPCPPCGFATENHAWPAFSPDGQRLAFFRIAYIDPLLHQPAKADLIVADLSNSSAIQVASFAPGVYPAGLSWSRNGADLLFSVGNQSHEAGLFMPLADPASAVLRTVPASGGAISQIPGAPVGYMPAGTPLPDRIFRGNFEG